MKDLIERQDVIDEIEERKSANGYRNVAVISELNRLEGYIMRLPLAQSKIIKCKDCKYWKQQTNYQGSPLSFGFCENDDIRIYTNDNHYCGYAERRTDEGD